MLVDAHSDLLLEVAWREDEGEENPFAEHWLPKLERGGVGLQVCPVFVELEYLPDAATRFGLRQISAFHRALRLNAGRVRPVRSRADVDGEGVGLMLALEGAEPLGQRPELIEAFHGLGVRIVGLTWNRRNAFADGIAEPGGLTALGRELVDRLVELGVIVDLAHASERTFDDVLGRSGGASVVISHACCRAVHESPRNASDDQLRAVAERGGVLGLMALPLVVDPDRPTLERLCDHVDHAVSVMGADHVGLGGDFVRQIARAGATRLSARDRATMPGDVSLEDAVEGLAGPEDYPNLVETLRRRGYEGERLEGVLGGNFLRLFRRALPSA